MLLPDHTHSFDETVSSYNYHSYPSDNKILFGKTLFNSQLKQTIDIAISETTKEKMTSDIKAMKLDDVTTDIRKSKNAGKIAITDKKK